MTKRPGFHEGQLGWSVLCWIDRNSSLTNHTSYITQLSRSCAEPYSQREPPIAASSGSWTGIATEPSEDDPRVH